MTDHRTPSPSRWSGLQVSLLGIVGSFVGSHVFIEEAVVPGVDFLYGLRSRHQPGTRHLHRPV